MNRNLKKGVQIYAINQRMFDDSKEITMYDTAGSAFFKRIVCYVCISNSKLFVGSFVFSLVGFRGGSSRFSYRGRFVP